MTFIQWMTVIPLGLAVIFTAMASMSTTASSYYYKAADAFKRGDKAEGDRLKTKADRFKRLGNPFAGGGDRG